jgi:hypothetical protein
MSTSVFLYLSKHQWPQLATTFPQSTGLPHRSLLAAGTGVVRPAQVLHAGRCPAAHVVTGQPRGTDRSNTGTSRLAAGPVAA